MAPRFARVNGVRAAAAVAGRGRTAVVEVYLIGPVARRVAGVARHDDRRRRSSPVRRRRRPARRPHDRSAFRSPRPPRVRRGKLSVRIEPEGRRAGRGGLVQRDGRPRRPAPVGRAGDGRRPVAPAPHPLAALRPAPGPRRRAHRQGRARPSTASSTRSTRSSGSPGAPPAAAAATPRVARQVASGPSSPRTRDALRLIGTDAPAPLPLSGTELAPPSTRCSATSSGTRPRAPASPSPSSRARA